MLDGLEDWRGQGVVCACVDTAGFISPRRTIGKFSRTHLRRLSNHVLFFSLMDNVVNPLLGLRAMIPILMVTAEDEEIEDKTGSDPNTIIALYSNPPLTSSGTISVNS